MFSKLVHVQTQRRPAADFNERHVAGIKDDFSSICNSYCKSVGFYIDIASILPLELLYVFADSPADKQRVYMLFRLNRLLKTFQVMTGGGEGRGEEGRGEEGRGGEGREGKGREGKGREGKGREGKGREGKGREGKGREGKGR